jgi:histidine triad (HIT) family protein
MPSVFSKIVAGEIPCYKVAENNDFLAFLDINPLKEGHTLVIPKKEVDYLFDLDEKTYAELMLFARKTAVSILKACPAKRISMQVIGLEVPHAHIHLIPIDRMGDCNFSSPKLKLSAGELKSIAARIAGHPS